MTYFKSFLQLFPRILSTACNRALQKVLIPCQYYAQKSLRIFNEHMKLKTVSLVGYGSEFLSR